MCDLRMVATLSGSLAALVHIIVHHRGEKNVGPMSLISPT